jgi:ABC-type dipeptide/oligopeptide/nickel transport system permease subunit
MSDEVLIVDGLAIERQLILPGQVHLLRRLARDKVALVAALFLGAVVLVAAAAPWFAPFDPYYTDLTKVMLPPDDQHWFGTDNTGRDILSRVIFGARNTLLIGFIAVIVGGLLGGILGVLAAFYRALDGWIMRLVDIMLAFPAILIGLAVAAIAGAGLGAVVFALVVATIPDVARVARGAAIGVMGQEFIEAGRVVGVSDFTLIWRYLTLNCISTIFVYLTLRFGQIILIGLGPEFPRPGRAAADCGTRHDGRTGSRLPVHGAAYRDHPEPCHLRDRASCEPVGRRVARRAGSSPATIIKMCNQ